MPQRSRFARSLGAALTCLTLALTGCAPIETTPHVEETFDAPVRLDEVTVQRFQYPTADVPDPGQNWGDLYLPADDQRTDSIPLAVLIHGGAWQNHTGADTLDPLARELAGRGMAVFNVEYRRVGSGGGWPTTFRDVASALDHVVEVGKKVPRLSTDDELVVGHSAGAQLAVWGGTRHLLAADELGGTPAFRPTRVVSIAGPLDMAYAATHGDDRIVTALGGTPAGVPDRFRMVDPIQNIDPATLVLALHGTEDTTVPPENSTRYVEAVRKAGGRADLVLLEGQDHDSILSEDSPAYRQVLDRIVYASGARLDKLTP